MALRGVNAGVEVIACFILIMLAISCDGRKMLDEPVSNVPSMIMV